MAESKDVWEDYIYYIVDKLRVNYGLRWIFKDRRNKDYFNKVPCLQICATNDNNGVNVPDGCPCRTKEFSSFTVNLKSYFSVLRNEEKDLHFTLNFPTKSLSELTTYTFINKSMADKYFGKKLCFSYDPEKNQSNTMMSDIKNSFKKFNPKTTVLIILSHSDYFIKFLDICRDLLDCWSSPFNEMIIWGAVVDTLSVCRFNLNKHYCKIDTELLLIFVSNPSLKIYPIQLDVHYDSAEKIQRKLKELKDEMVLSLHSIALMHISYFRMRLLYGLDISIFKQIFPNVCLFTFYGDASFSEKYLKDSDATTKLPFYKIINLCTSILILSHD